MGVTVGDCTGSEMAANMTVTLEDLTTDFEHCLEVWHEHGCAPPPRPAAATTV